MMVKHKRSRRVSLLKRCRCKANDAARMLSFLQLKINQLWMELLLCVGKPTNWEWGRNNAVCEVFSNVKHSAFVGCFSPSLPLPSPTDKSFCPSNEAIPDRIQPFCTEKCIQLCFKTVKEMNHWSVSGIFNYYSLCCTGTIMAAMSLY